MATDRAGAAKAHRNLVGVVLVVGHPGADTDLRHGATSWHYLRPVVGTRSADRPGAVDRRCVRDIPVEVALGPEDGVAGGSVANLDNVQLVPVAWLVQRAGAIAPARWPEVCGAMAHTIGCG